MITTDTPVHNHAEHTQRRYTATIDGKYDIYLDPDDQNIPYLVRYGPDRHDYYWIGVHTLNTTQRNEGDSHFSMVYNTVRPFLLSYTALLL